MGKDSEYWSGVHQLRSRRRQQDHTLVAIHRFSGAAKREYRASPSTRTSPTSASTGRLYLECPQCNYDGRLCQNQLTPNLENAMAKKLQNFWSLIAVVVCFGLAMAQLGYGESGGMEEAPRWAFDTVTLAFTAIFLVSLQMGLNAQAKDSQKQKK